MTTYNIGKDTIPAIGLGTWKSDKDKVYEAVRHAIQVGYRHIDCAAIYGNEKQVGSALKDAFEAGEVKREDLWITSKLWNDAHLKEDVRPALEKTLQDLQLDYLDLYLIHWPIAFASGTSMAKEESDYLTRDEAPLEKTWEAMLAAKEDGLARHVGVSNFNIEQLRLLKETSGQYPEVLQVESHPYFDQAELVKFCENNDIVFTAYSPIGSGNDEIFDDATLKELADKHNATVAQVMLAWAVGRGTVAIPKSTNKDRIKENFDAHKIKLSSDEIENINRIDKQNRYIDGTFFTGPASPYNLKDIWG